MRMRPILTFRSDSFKPRRRTGHRQGDPEACAGAAAGDVDPSVVRVYDLADNGQAEARPLWLGGEKRVENPVGQLRRNPRPVVIDVDQDQRNWRLRAWKRRIVFGSGDHRANRQMAGAVESLERVGDEIGEDLAELMVVAGDHR